METTRQSLAARRIEWLCLAIILTFAAHKFPEWVTLLSAGFVPGVVQVIGYGNYYWLWTFAFGVLLVVASPKRYGVRIGLIRPHIGKTAFVCILPVVLTAIVYPQLPVRPFSGAPVGSWLISPLAQDLVFIGYLYTKFDDLFPGFIHRRVPIRWALIITGFFFAAWHLPNFAGIPAGYVVFQLFYSFAGFVFIGLSRQWTGSIIYMTCVHMAVNLIAWLP